MADSYNESRYTPNADRGIVWPEIVRFLEPYLKNASTVLDLGAGYCDFVNNVSAPNRIAADLSPESATFAAPGVKHIVTPADDLSQVQDASVDVVFSSNLLEHLTDDQLGRAMNEVQRVLKPTGLFITMQPNYRLAYKTYFDDPTHKKVFSDVALRNFLLQYHFRIVRSWPRFLPFSLASRPGLIPVSPLVVRAYLHSPWKPLAGQMLFIAGK
jgi:ubiquinone/menaquinone biosynthesis C-methylase UbiE